MALYRHGFVCSFLVILACGDDGDVSDGTAQTTAMSQSTTDGTSSGSETSLTGATMSTTDIGTTDTGTADTGTTASTTTDADSSTGNNDVDVPCGDALVCGGGDVCIEDAFDPECTNLEDPEGMCPDGQNMTNCGGAGIPCCCLPPPASEFRCVTPSECDGAATCECLGPALCTDGRQCTSLGADPEHLFRCESPAKP